MLTIPFAPKHGGVETVVELLSRALVQKSHEVCVATLQPSQGSDAAFPFEILRQPSPYQLFKAFWKCDQVILHGATLQLGWPLFLLPRRAWLVHHIWPPFDKSLLTRLIRKLLYRRCQHLAVSRALAAALPGPVALIPNPFDDSQFQVLQPPPVRNRDLVFLGRLVPLKGLEDLIDALLLLKREQCFPLLTIIGEGPERPRLEAKVQAEGLAAQVSFTGALPTAEVVRLLNSHRIQVVPSRYDEPFGVVALEGIACGCSIIGSAGGGLPDAIGPCGSTFPNRDAAALASEIHARLASEKGLPAAVAEQHLAKHRPLAVANAYLQVMQTPG